MRANLPALERTILARWRDLDLYPRLLEQRADGASFVLHDGPPYASGSLQWSHVLNKILKDFVLRSRSMRGERCEFTPGWDCHGLPIELEVEKLLNVTPSSMDKLAMRKACRIHAEHSIVVQRDQFERLGILGRWQQAYVTMSPSYQAAITRALASLMRSESLIQRTRPVFWDTANETALAEFEVSYRLRALLEAYIAFPLVSDPIHLGRHLRGRNVDLVCWTSSVWTVPAVTALAVDPDASYAAVRRQRKIVLVHEDRLAATAEACGWGTQPDVVTTVPGHTLARQSNCRHPLLHRQLRVVDAPGLKTARGTGILPLCPGHDLASYEIAQAHDLDVYSPVDEKGRFTSQVDRWAGQPVWSVEPSILRKLQAFDALLSPIGSTVMRKVPHSWRSEEPVIFRATPQWFVPMDAHDLRKRALASLDQVQWIPAWGHKRMASLLHRRSDWCLSRQRAWGVPLPIFYCKRCSTPLLDPDHVEELAARYKQHPHGADLWFELPVEELLPTEDDGGELRCFRCGNHTFRKEEDIVDVWFDSGVSAWAVLRESCPDGALADMCVEGVEQFRGWFQGSLLTSLQLCERVPFRTVVAHGRVGGEVPLLTAEQEQMQALAQQHKLQTQEPLDDVPTSPEPYTPPTEMLEAWGAELLRLWVATDDLHLQRVFRPHDMEVLIHAYRKVRNTFRFLLGNLYDFDRARDRVEWELMEDLDRYILHRLHHRLVAIRSDYEALRFHLAWRNILEFCTNELSGFYFEAIKDRLYASAPDWSVRRSAQSALLHIADVLCRCIAPILCFTAEEIWLQLADHRDAPESVHWALLPAPDEVPVAPDMAGIWSGVRSARKQVLRAFARRKDELHLKRPSDARVRLYPHTTRLREALELCDEEQLPLYLGVSQAEVVAKDTPAPHGAWRSQWGSLAVEVLRAKGRRCCRCGYTFADLEKAAAHPTCARCQRAMEQQKGAEARGV